MEQTRGRFAGPPLTPRTAVIWSVLRAELDRRGDARALPPPAVRAERGG
ncbi:hypothetical protein JM949_34160 [Micromonospora sp. STR1s_6]|uniref:Uncharacterized protein n=1 Tax=Micromonospora tarensis TaxID=2806100 RepID=A0ABS1YR08_9ACTN|nr:hypothetical protein [Micromonospora tarensis]MBM0279873.1 hypothetical protein [Micromonospora tarensis]